MKPSPAMRSQVFGSSQYKSTIPLGRAVYSSRLILPPFPQVVALRRSSHPGQVPASAVDGGRATGCGGRRACLADAGAKAAMLVAHGLSNGWRPGCSMRRSRLAPVRKSKTPARKPHSLARDTHTVARKASSLAAKRFSLARNARGFARKARCICARRFSARAQGSGRCS